MIVKVFMQLLDLFIEPDLTMTITSYTMPKDTQPGGPDSHADHPVDCVVAHTLSGPFINHLSSNNWLWLDRQPARSLGPGMGEIVVQPALLDQFIHFVLG